MNVRQLIIELEKYPENMSVVLFHEDLEYTHFELENVEKRLVGFGEDEGDEVQNKKTGDIAYCEEECVILSGD